MRNDLCKVSTLISLCLAAATIGGDASLAAETAKPSRLEQIPGSDLKRVVLTPKAAQRLGIKRTKVYEEPVLRWLLVEGIVEAMPAEHAVTATAASPQVNADLRARVRLLDPNQLQTDPNPTQSNSRLASQRDDDDDDDNDDDDDDDQKQSKDKVTGKGKGNIRDRYSAVVIPIGIAHAAPLPTRPIQVATAPGDAKAMTDAGAMVQTYEVTKADHRLRLGQRVYVRLPRPDNGKTQKVIPYSAVIYDRHGDTWTYTNPEPQVFVRNRIDVEFIEGRRAVLREGPATGTVVVATGAAVLLGIEQKFGQ